MITDDSKDFRKALKEVLKEIYEVEFEGIGNVEFIEEAENGLELLEKIKTNKPELIFMDIEMPYMNGFEATKKIVSLYPDIKIIGMSSYEKEIYIQKLIDVGAHGYFIKTGNNYEGIKELIAGKADSFVFSCEINHYLPFLKSHKTILFVDRSESQHLSLRHFLFKCGYTVLKAQNATESIFFMKEKDIDAVIIDQSVIKRNNNFVSTLLENTKKIKVFLINGNDNTTEIKNNLNNELIYLENDFSFETIVKILEK